MEATPGIEIQGKCRPVSRLASNRQSITQLQRYESHQSPGFPLSVHGVVQIRTKFNQLDLNSPLNARGNFAPNPNLLRLIV
jgi:hypothetical protein